MASQRSGCGFLSKEYLQMKFCIVFTMRKENISLNSTWATVLSRVKKKSRLKRGSKLK